MSITVAAIWRHPVKGLSPEPLDAVPLAPGAGLPWDRAFAIAHGSTQIDLLNPEWMPKANFLMLSRNPRLAALSTSFDDATQTLIIRRDGREVARAALGSAIGRTRLADFMAAYLKDEVRGTPKVVAGNGHMFSDHKEKVVSLFSRASLAAVERVAGRPLDPRRFRANLMVDGTEEWAEFSWIGRRLTIGTAVLEVKERIDRCPATSANPDSGAVDINLPLTLRKAFGHIDFGVYCRVIAGGTVAVGDALMPATISGSG